MATTLAEFRSNLREMGNLPSNDTRFTDAVLNREINRALKRIAMIHDWPWLQDEREIVTEADRRAYALPSDFLRMTSVRYKDDSSNLWLRSIQEVDEVEGTGWSRMFAIYAGKLHLAPTPSGAVSIMLRYVRQERVLVGDTDAPLIPDYWNDGVYEAALVELHRQAKQLDESGLAEARFQTWVKETQDNIRQHKGPVRVRVRPGSFI